jgi:hypothetical protein
MALQLGALRTALLDAGAASDKADKAAEEVAGFDNRIASVETRLAVLTWMTGANIALTLLVLGSMFLMWAKLGDISGQLAMLARAAQSHS